MDEFKKGDVVQCIDAVASSGEAMAVLTLGRFYLVTGDGHGRTDNTLIATTCDLGDYETRLHFPRRFRLVPEDEIPEHMKHRRTMLWETVKT